MAEYSVERSKHSTLAVLTADRITFTRGNARFAIVFNRGNLGPIFVRTDGTDPTVSGDETFVVPDATQRIIPFLNIETKIVRLICSAAAPYSVEIQ